MPGTRKVWNFCFVAHNYSQETLKSIRGLESKSKYLVFGYERSKVGTPHLQGYCQLLEPMAMHELQKLNSWHVEAARSGGRRASDYCKKTGSFEVYGVPPVSR